MNKTVSVTKQLLTYRHMAINTLLLCRGLLKELILYEDFGLFDHMKGRDKTIHHEQLELVNEELKALDYEN